MAIGEQEGPSFSNLQGNLKPRQRILLSLASQAKPITAGESVSLLLWQCPNNADFVIKLAALPDSQRHRMAAPLLEYRQHTTSTGLASVLQLDVPLPSSRPEASSSSFSNNKDLEIDAEARKQELYRQKVEQTGVEREAYRK